MVGLSHLLLAVLGGSAPFLSSQHQQLKVIPLTELESASEVRADHGKIYIKDKKDIAVHSFDTGRFHNRIGRPGQGPGEFSYLGSFCLVGDRLIAADIGKAIIFSADGEYLGQVVPPSRIMRYPYLPVGNHFVGVPLERKEDGTELPLTLILYDENGKPVKRIYEVPDVLPPPPPRPGASLPSGKMKNLMVREYFDYLVYDHKIFMADSTKGLSISVFDETGNLLYEIRHPVDRIKVSKEYQEQTIMSLTEAFLQNNQPIFPDYFPAFVAMKIDGGKIFLITPARKDNFNEVIVMDLNGKTLERSFRFPIKIDYFAPYNFARRFDVEQGKFIWVEYNEPAGQYELQIY
ncbi:MAG: 6-bladed beta-propeller [Candidatus Saccharicenans sp.]|uniref:6-bladed beta-propeller n=1 Tax=Candidatus Saccharicenans sp. TaxID=2819258 RepID=UPI00404AE27D